VDCHPLTILLLPHQSIKPQRTQLVYQIRVVRILTLKLCISECIHEQDKINSQGFLLRGYPRASRLNCLIAARADAGLPHLPCKTTGSLPHAKRHCRRYSSIRISFRLSISRCLHTFSNCFGRLPDPVGAQLFKIDLRHFDVNIDTVRQRTRDSPGHYRRGTQAGLLGVAR
jgi:hypothetical protein